VAVVVSAIQGIRIQLNGATVLLLAGFPVPIEDGQIGQRDMAVGQVGRELDCFRCGLAYPRFSFEEWNVSKVKTSYPAKCDACVSCAEIRLEPDRFFKVADGFRLVMVIHIPGVIAPSKI